MCKGPAIPGLHYKQVPKANLAAYVDPKKSVKYIFS